MYAYKPRYAQLAQLYYPYHHIEAKKPEKRGLRWAKRLIYGIIGTMAFLGLLYQFAEISALYFARLCTSSLQIRREW